MASSEPGRCARAKQIAIPDPVGSLEDIAARADVVTVIRILARSEQIQPGDTQHPIEGEAPSVEKHANAEVLRSSDPKVLAPGSTIDRYLALATEDSGGAEVILVGDLLDAAYQPGTTAVAGLARTASGFSNAAGTVVDTGSGLAPVGRPECYAPDASPLGDQVAGETTDSLFEQLVDLRSRRPQ